MTFELMNPLEQSLQTSMSLSCLEVVCWLTLRLSLFGVAPRRARALGSARIPCRRAAGRHPPTALVSLLHPPYVSEVERSWMMTRGSTLIGTRKTRRMPLKPEDSYDPFFSFSPMDIHVGEVG